MIDKNRIRGIDHPLGNLLDERGNVAQSEIEPLPRQRMDEMGGVADQRQPGPDEFPRDDSRRSRRLVWL